MSGSFYENRYASKLARAQRVWGFCDRMFDRMRQTRSLVQALAFGLAVLRARRPARPPLPRTGGIA